VNQLLIDGNHPEIGWMGCLGSDSGLYSAAYAAASDSWSLEPGYCLPNFPVGPGSTVLVLDLDPIALGLDCSTVLVLVNLGCPIVDYCPGSTVLDSGKRLDPLQSSIILMLGSDLAKPMFSFYSGCSYPYGFWYRQTHSALVRFRISR